MKEKDEILKMEICECGQKNVADAIEIFQDTSLPFKKAKKLVTECNKSCCRAALLKIYDMKQFGRYDYDEIAYVIEQRLERIKRLGEGESDDV
ncbi:NaeI family type II restriction endonuclease [bacterium]|jgi:ethanolamine utilization protein EutQ (cupin superfamily)|nr:NaeI family type II restriction endonuclease [bacterium]